MLGRTNLGKFSVLGKATGHCLLPYLFFIWLGGGDLGRTIKGRLSGFLHCQCVGVLKGDGLIFCIRIGRTNQGVVASFLHWTEYWMGNESVFCSG